MAYNVVEIFDSIEGEGKRTGAPASFIRLAGCNLRCAYCDTSYALKGEHSTLSLGSILSRLNRRFRRVTLTGGEPLIAPNVDKLIKHMLADGFEVNIETNGSVDITPFRQEINMNLFFTMDYKLNTSEMNSQMFMDNFFQLQPWDVIKFVIGSKEDVSHMIDVLHHISPVQPLVYVHSVYGGYDLKELAHTILHTPVLKNVRLGVQLHKIVWDPFTRGV